MVTIHDIKETEMGNCVSKSEFKSVKEQRDYNNDCSIIKLQLKRPLNYFERNNKIKFLSNLNKLRFYSNFT